MSCWGGRRWGWATHGRHWAPEFTCRLRLKLGYNGAGAANWGCLRPTLASALSHKRGSLGHGSLGPTTEELGDGGRRWGGKVQGLTTELSTKAPSGPLKTPASSRFSSIPSISE